MAFNRLIMCAVASALQPPARQFVPIAPATGGASSRGARLACQDWNSSGHPDKADRPRCAVSLNVLGIFVEALSHVEMVLKGGQSGRGPILQFEVVASIAIALE